MLRQMTAIAIVLVVLLSAFAGCKQAPHAGGTAYKARGGQNQAPSAVPLTVATETSGKFTRLSPDECGIDFLNDVTDEQVWLAISSTQSGMAAGDYDADGDIDLYLIGINTPNKLYRNEGGFKFIDVTAESGEGLDGGEARGSAGVFADLDNDADLDLYVCNKLEANQLFINDGQGKFTEEAKERGVDSQYTSVQTAIADYDNDGDLDMYLCNYRSQGDDPSLVASLQPAPGKEASIPANLQHKYYVDPWNRVMMKPDPDEYFLNDGSGHFKNWILEAGLSSNSFSLAAQATDFTNDGLVDIYLSSDFELPDHFFVNDGDGTFTDRAKDMVRKTPLFGMGCDSGDVNLDGLPDLISPDMLARDYKRAKRQSGDMWQWRREMLYMEPQPQMRNMLQINRGEGWFSETAQMCGVDATDWTWAARIADFNSDGRPEIFTTTGNARDSMDVDTTMSQAKQLQAGVPLQEVTKAIINQPIYAVEDYLFEQKEPLKFSLVEGAWGIDEVSFDAGVTLADFDGDGDRDAIISNSRGKTMVYRNDIEQGNRIAVDLRQEGANSEAVGARVWAHCADYVAMEDVILARGYATGEPSRLYLPLGKHEKVDRLVVRWPDGAVQEHTDLGAGMHYTIYRHNDLPMWEPEPVKPLFKQSDLDWQQKEIDTQAVEFEKEPLLPVQQTTLGTGAGVCDYDLDGNLDLYTAGAAGQQGQLFKGNGDGTFAAVANFADAMPAEAEEMAVLWFDANGDGRQDMLVTSGGEELEPGSELYQPRLYLNSPGGLSNKTLPQRHLSTGAAAAADTDGDGDLDLLLCGHIQQYAFGKVVPSALWRNDGQGNFSDATAENLAGIDKGGQIADAQFADFNGDSRPDLLLARVWGRVELWTNSAGKFSLSRGLTETGWWRSLGIGDFDNDGDLDVICGNIGQDTKYHPKEGAPVTLFANDFDKNGTRDLIEVKYRKDGCMLPGRGRSCSGYAISYIPQKWPTWASFADATLEDVYGPGLKTAERFEITSVHNVLAVNNGDGTFTEKDLPGTAQWAPMFGVAVGDFNCDGNLDAYAANNFTPSQPEAGHWCTGYGVLLVGDGAGGFEDLWPAESGIRIYQDGRGAIPADFNGDGLLDIFASVSNAAPKVLLATADEKQGGGLWVELKGKGANPAATGAKLVLSLSDGRKLTRLVQAGSGYLSSYSGPVHFGLPADGSAASLSVTWPDGSSSEVTEFSGGRVEVSQ